MLGVPSAEVHFAIRDSRWLGAPLSAHGRLRLTGERLRQADVAVTLGGNRISAKGALGAPGDTLAVAFNLSRPALIDRQLQGSLRGTAQVSGSWHTPRARFELAGVDLAHTAYGRVKALRVLARRRGH